MRVAFIPNTGPPTHPGRFRAPVSAASAPLALGVPFEIDGLLALWPDARLAVEAAFGAALGDDPDTWTWYDITTDVRIADGGLINITPMGRSDETSSSQPAGCAFQVANDGGDYTAYNPASKWYPYVRRNTPIRVRVNLTGLATGWNTRFEGYTTGFVPGWDIAAAVPVVNVSAQGITRRLAQGKTPLKSPLCRANLTLGPVAYWPLEDGTNSTEGAAATAGTPAMRPTGQVSVGWADATNPIPGSLPGPLFGYSVLAGSISVSALSARAGGTNATAWTIGGWFSASLRDDNATDDSRTVLLYWGGRPVGASGRDWTLFIASGPGWTGAFEVVLNFGGLTRVYLADGDPFDGNPHHVMVTAVQTGANEITTTLWYDHVAYTAPTVDGNPATPYTLQPVDLVGVGGNLTEPVPDATHDGRLRMVHVAVFDRALTQAEVDRIYVAGHAHVGETATARLARICTEEGIPIEITGSSTSTMGPQGVDAVMPILREAETADQGVLYDGRGPGLTYITRAERYNLATALALDMAVDPPQVTHPFDPKDDDQRNRNVAKVDRKNGTSKTYEQPDGPLGTDAIGVYDTSLTVSVDSDEMPLQYASWLVHLGTAEGFRYPTLNLDLAAVPAIAAGWLACRVSSRVDVSNVTSRAPQHPAGDIRLLLEGWSEQLSPFDWMAQVNASRFDPWVVAVLDQSGFLDCGACTTAEVVDTTETDIDVAIADTCTWTHADGDYDITINGEDMTVTAVSAPSGGGSSWTQTLTVTRSVNSVVRAHDPGSEIHVADPFVLAL